MNEPLSKKRNWEHVFVKGDPGVWVFTETQIKDSVDGLKEDDFHTITKCFKRFQDGKINTYQLAAELVSEIGAGSDFS